MNMMVVDIGWSGPCWAPEIYFKIETKDGRKGELQLNFDSLLESGQWADEIMWRDEE